MVIYPFVLFKAKRKNVSEQLFRHELEHVYQVEELGWFSFYISYLWLLVRHGYDDHPYEREAYAAEHSDLDEWERNLYES